MVPPLLFLLLLVASAAANKTEDCSSFELLENSPEWTDYNQLIQSELQFTADLCRKIGMRRSADNLNVVFTPFNIYNSLLVMYFMTASRTEEIIGELFHIPKNQTKSSIHAIYNTLTLHKRSTIDYRVKNKTFNSIRGRKKTKERVQFMKDDFCIFLSNKFKVKSCAQKFFGRNIEIVDFKNPNETVQKVNGWVTNRTGHFQDTIQQNDFNAYTHMLFANTAFFHGVWNQPFTSLKPNEEFRMLDGTTRNVTMMVKTGKYKIWYDEDLKADILEIPYESNTYKVLILLPRFESPSVVAHILKALSKQKLNDIIINEKKVKKHSVTIEIPKFKVEKTYNLINTMKYLGFKEIFEVPIDFSNILDQQGKDQQITKFRVKAVYSVTVQFDESSTQVKPVVGSNSNKSKFEETSSGPNQTVFRADHPFVYFIYTSNNLVVLGGVLYHP